MHPCCCLQVRLGSFVEVLSGELDAAGKDKPYLMEVTELFEDSRVQHSPTPCFAEFLMAFWQLSG